MVSNDKNKPAPAPKPAPARAPTVTRDHAPDWRRIHGNVDESVNKVSNVIPQRPTPKPPPSK